MANRVGGKMGDRTYYVAEVRVAGGEIIYLDPEDPIPAATVMYDILRASERQHTDRKFFVAYMWFDQWLVGDGQNLTRAVTHLRERYSEVLDS